MRVRSWKSGRYTWILSLRRTLPSSASIMIAGAVTITFVRDAQSKMVSASIGSRRGATLLAP